MADRIHTEDYSTHEGHPGQLSRQAAANGKAFCGAIRKRLGAICEGISTVIGEFDRPELNDEQAGRVSGLEALWTALAHLEDEVDKAKRKRKSKDSATPVSTPPRPTQDFQAAIDRHWASVAEANRKAWEK